jgi:hypothetical protein
MPPTARACEGQLTFSRIDTLNLGWSASVHENLGECAVPASDIDPAQIGPGFNQSRKILPTDLLHVPIIRS